MQILHELQRYLSIGDVVELIYLDRSNSITKRMVKLLTIDNDNVHAFCYSRRAPRNFLINNILAVAPPSRIQKSTS